MSAPGQEAESTTPTAPSEGEAAPQETTSTPAPDFDRLYARMDELAVQNRQLAESLTQPEAEEEEPDYYDEQGGLTEDGARALIADLVREQVDTQLAPRDAARLVEQRDDAYEALKDAYPDLQDPALAQPILDKAVRWAMSTDERIVDRPEFVDVIEAFYKAEKYEELQAAQAAEQPRPVVLEGAGGAGRPQPRGPQEPDWEKRVIDAASRDGARI